MNKTGRKLMSVVLASAMALSLTACGSAAAPAASSAAPAASEAPAASSAAPASTAAASTAAASETASAAGDYEECTLTFDWWGGDSRHEATQKAVDAFMKKYPGITVQCNFGAWKDWETARALEFQSGTAPDVNQINANWINDYDADGSTFLDLTTVADTIDLTQWDQKYLDLCKDSKGGQASVPVSMTGRIFYWDKTTFDEAGIDTPKTLADLMAAGKTFKDKLGDDYYPLALGTYDRMILVDMYLQSKYDTQFIKDGKLSFTEDQLLEGVNFIKSLEDAHVIPSMKIMDGDAADSLDKNEKFISGKYAGMLEWDSSPAKYVSALGDSRELVVGEEFTDLGGGKTTGAFTKVSLSFAISAKTEHPHEAALLINYLLNDPEGIAIMSTERGIPESKIAYSTLDAANAFDPLVKEAHDKVMASAAYSFDPKFDDSSLKDGENGAYQDAFAGLSYGDYKPEEAANVLFTAFSEVLK